MATRLFGSQTSLREANRANLLASIHKFGAMTQVELAEVTGLSTATVSTLVHQLVDEDQLETKNTVRNGRRATLVTLARHQGLGVGLWIARRHLTLSIVDFSKSIIAEHTLPLPLGHKADTTLERAMLLINETLSSIDAEASELVGIGVAVAAPVAFCPDGTASISRPRCARRSTFPYTSIMTRISRHTANPVWAWRQANAISYISQPTTGLAQASSSTAKSCMA